MSKNFLIPGSYCGSGSEDRPRLSPRLAKTPGVCQRRLEEEKAGISGDIRDVYHEAKLHRNALGHSQSIIR
ncbi:DUF2312 domain-containing protein [Microvirga sp. BT688]|uniref:GapR family DNA-binding domain-containing protein n=1 Tax=Microvirga sp. TaxID=1873136 RepID=UPI00168719AA|nr:DUF2312 domain-containing protein [Microvirga sp.]